MHKLIAKGFHSMQFRSSRLLRARNTLPSFFIFHLLPQNPHLVWVPHLSAHLPHLRLALVWRISLTSLSALGCQSFLSCCSCWFTVRCFPREASLFGFCWTASLELLLERIQDWLQTLYAIYKSELPLRQVKKSERTNGRNICSFILWRHTSTSLSTRLFTKTGRKALNSHLYST